MLLIEYCCWAQKTCIASLDWPVASWEHSRSTCSFEFCLRCRSTSLREYDEVMVWQSFWKLDAFVSNYITYINERNYRRGAPCGCVVDQLIDRFHSVARLLLILARVWLIFCHIDFRSTRDGLIYCPNAENSRIVKNLIDARCQFHANFHQCNLIQTKDWWIMTDNIIHVWKQWVDIITRPPQRNGYIF